jgi:hypothetical protein
MMREIIIEKVNYFFTNNIKVHIKKENRIFNNGIIISIADSFLTLRDDRFGDTRLFFSEIFDISEFVEPKDEQN